MRGIGELTPPPGGAGLVEPVLRAAADHGGLNWMQAVELVRETPSMYLELSTAGIVFAVRLAIEEIPDRTLFGSDAPYGDPVLARALVERVTGPGEVRDRVLGGTMAELVGLG
ncbi:amidohydrolase family protein [Streptomyces sp. NPDC058734]|uniref:amidohydrolase family protein n=1 Tax=Streptomyces sp. NPDC058734 TaxID=3346615 RepID=UPI0036A405B4